MTAILPLAGLKVLDFTRVLAGPLCTMMLGDLGAHVIKVEKPGTGDETRGWGPPFDSRGESAYFLSINRNKLSIAADLRHGDVRGMIRRLIRDADVVVENFLPRTAATFGLDAGAAIEANPRLVWCTITGFGPGSSRPGYDFVVQAEAGWMAITGEPTGAPAKSGVALADVIAGKDAAVAILAALVGRSEGARRLVISLAASARAALVNVAQNALVAERDANRWGNAHANLVPYQLFDAMDRALVITVGTDAQWVTCMNALGLADLAADESVATNSGRLANRERVVAAIAAAVAQRTAQHWVETLGSAGVPCGIVKSVLEAIRESVGASPLSGMPSSVGGTVRFPPPTLDQHGDLIRRAGWDAFHRYV